MQPRRGADQHGFSLIEVVVALAILAIVLLSFLGTRTDALADASEARNWRLAREIAEQTLSELQAGARDRAPDGGRSAIEKYPGFQVQVVVGEAAIAELEASELSEQDVPGGSETAGRRSWQRERDDLRRAQQQGVSLYDYREKQLREEIDKEGQRQPSEDDFEEVLVVVYFPEVRLDAKRDEASVRLRAKLSTLAIEGLTPEEAELLSDGLGGKTTPATTGETPAESGV